jgi:hypothetical protein
LTYLGALAAEAGSLASYHRFKIIGAVSDVTCSQTVFDLNKARQGEVASQPCKEVSPGEFWGSEDSKSAN